MKPKLSYYLHFYFVKEQSNDYFCTTVITYNFCVNYFPPDFVLIRVHEQQFYILPIPHLYQVIDLLCIPLFKWIAKEGAYRSFVMKHILKTYSYEKTITYFFIFYSDI